MDFKNDSFYGKQLRQLWAWKLELARLQRLRMAAYRDAKPKPGENGWSVLRELRETKKAAGTDGQPYDTQPFITEAEGQVLHRCILDAKPKLALEIGFLHGYSTLHILQGLADIGTGRLLSIDPFQFDPFARGIGVMNVRRSGLERHHLFWSGASQFVLPHLSQRNVRFDFAFVDGSHLFDFTLLEFFYIDKMIDAGAQVVFHDYLNPSVYAAAQFIEANLAYAAVSCPEKNLRILCKKEDDSRPWYYFVPFQISDVAWTTLENRRTVDSASK
jgi:predicted O-methyltransferase YrrM